MTFLLIELLGFVGFLPCVILWIWFILTHRPFLCWRWFTLLRSEVNHGGESGRLADTFPSFQFNHQLILPVTRILFVSHCRRNGIPEELSKWKQVISGGRICFATDTKRFLLKGKHYFDHIRPIGSWNVVQWNPVILCKSKCPARHVKIGYTRR